MRHGGGGRPLLGGEGEDADALNARLLQEGAELFKLLFALAGKPRDEARAEHQPRDALAQSAKQRADLVPGAAPVHALQDCVIDVLDGDIQIFDDLIVLRDLVDQLVVELIGVEVVEPDPLDALDLRKLLTELRKAAFPVEIGAVARNVLRDDDELPDAVGGKLPCLRDDVFEPSRAVVPPDVGDRAEGAEVVAALRDAQVSPARPGGHDAGDLLHGGVFIAEEACAAPREHRVGGAHDVPEAPDAEHGVDLRQLLQDRILVALAQTARDDQTAQPALLLELRHLQNVVDGLALRGVDEAAGIHDREIRPLRLGHQREAGLVEKVEHLLAVDQILGAAKRDHGKGFLHQSSSMLSV